MNEKRLKILLIIFSVLLIIFIVYIILNKGKSEKTDNENNEQKEELFDTVNSETLFTIGDMDEITYDNETYTKIKITMDNNQELNAKMDQYLFEITDDKQERISICYTAAYGDLSFDDIFPKEALAKNITTGYIYCKASNENVSYLKMTYLIDHYLPESGGIKNGIHYYKIGNSNE